MASCWPERAKLGRTPRGCCGLPPRLWAEIPSDSAVTVACLGKVTATVMCRCWLGRTQKLGGVPCGESEADRPLTVTTYTSGVVTAAGHIGARRGERATAHRENSGQDCDHGAKARDRAYSASMTGLAAGSISRHQGLPWLKKSVQWPVAASMMATNVPRKFFENECSPYDTSRIWR
jgi:hypothetical protein